MSIDDTIENLELFIRDVVERKDLVLLDDNFEETGIWEETQYINIKTEFALEVLCKWVKNLPVHSSICSIEEPGIYMYDEFRGEFVSVTEEFMRIKNAFITIKRKS